MRNKTLLYLAPVMGCLVGCQPTATKTETDGNALETPVTTATDSAVVFTWPDTIEPLPAKTPPECYFDEALAAYAADTAFYAQEDACIEAQLHFEAHCIQPLGLPKEWRDNKPLRDMVTLYNFMEILHAIETDFDTYNRYNTYFGDYEDEDETEETEETDTIEDLKTELFAELDKISLAILPDKDLRDHVKALVAWIKSQVNDENESDEDDNNHWDITDVIEKLTSSWYPTGLDDTLFLANIDSRISPQRHLPDWVPDIYDRFVGSNAAPTPTDQTEILKHYNAALNFDEKLAWGYTMFGMHFGWMESTELLLPNAESLMASGNYSTLLDPFWRGYRIAYNNIHSCPSTYCYSPNLRYNHFRRMIAYTTLRHIEAHPEDDVARIQYYFMVVRPNILRLSHSYPFGNSAGAEAIDLYWHRKLLDY